MRAVLCFDGCSAVIGRFQHAIESPSTAKPPSAVGDRMTLPPPPPSPADTRRVKALARAVAMDLRRHGAPAIDAAGKVWMEQRPQSLWPLLGATVAAGASGRRDDMVITACRWLLANQLELIRYRLERGHDWARVMLDAYQEKLIALAQTNTLPEADWFVLVNLLKDAKVPIRPEMAEALARARADAMPDDAFSPQDMQRELRLNLDEIGRSTSDPFMVVAGLAETGTLMPPEMRAYLTHELGLSPHPVLREAVPLLLLDPEPAVRQAAAAVLGPEPEQPNRKKRIGSAARTQRTNPAICVT